MSIAQASSKLGRVKCYTTGVKKLLLWIVLILIIVILPAVLVMLFLSI
jgi:hypothetical protein